MSRYRTRGSPIFSAGWARIVLAGAAALSLSASVVAQWEVDWSSIDGGGGTSSGGGFEVSGTIGQPDASAAEALSGGDFTLTGGFWPVTMPACTTFVAPDFDQDCDVDLADFDRFKACVSGPEVPYNPVSLPPGCDLPVSSGILASDFDGDTDTDQDDFSILQRCISGADVAADSDCAN